MPRPSHLSPDNILRFLQIRSEPASTNEIAQGLHLKKADTRPLFKMLAHAANPALMRAMENAPVTVTGQDCDYDVFGDGPRTSCAKALGFLSARGISYTLVEAAEGADVKLHVGGITAVFVDQNKYLLHRLPWFIGAVVLLSFILLMLVFRSILVPVKAAIMNLLSIGASYGVVSLATSGGWVSHAIGIKEATPVPGFIPMMMFAILFGLSMDYEVFLLSRVREEYVRTGDNATAVAEGLAQTARVITAAAAIMVCVFGAFILGDQVFVKMVGLGMATAIFVDATVVRMVLVPATMELLGDRNWWYPEWLDRITPRISVEGHIKDLDAELAQVLGEAPERV